MRYIVGNWKMNLSLADITAWLNEFNKALPTIPSNKTVIIAPSLPYLGLLTDLTAKQNVSLASQDVSAFDKGAHTGETGAYQITDFCRYCIVGHSERKESIEVVLKKRDLCLANKIIPIVCFVNFNDSVRLYKRDVILAWEDPSNISKDGQYRPKPKDEIQQGINEIRRQLPQDAILIYGGSVNRDNIEQLSQIKGLDGILPGQASTQAVHFAELISIF